MEPKPGRTWQTCGGALLAAIGIFGAVYACRASRAHWLYYGAKYGAHRDDVNAVLGACEAAHRLYPHNYYLCMWAAEQAYRGRKGLDGEARARRLRAATNWCDAGLALNSRTFKLYYLKAKLMARSDPAAAAAYWARYVDWHFWEPRNHALLVDLYARAGDFELASASLDWVRGSEYDAWARGKLKAAWQQEMTPAVHISKIR